MLRFFRRESRVSASEREDPLAAADSLRGAEDALAAGNLDTALALGEAAVALAPHSAPAHATLGLIQLGRGDFEGAREAFARALQIDPGNGAIVHNLRVASSRVVPLWHFSMLHDRARNEAYEAAIRQAVRPGDLVFEIGTGSGLLAMMAARAGASRVVTCEAVAPLAAVAREIVEHNGFASTIDVVAKPSSRVSVPDDLPRPADVLVSEIVSADLIGEGLLASVEDARARLLAPGGRIVPRRAAVACRLAGSAQLDNEVRVGSVAGFDLGALNAFTPLKVHGAEVDAAYGFFSDAFEPFAFDFAAAETHPAERKVIALRATASGRCDGVLQWILLDLGEGIRHENAPGNDGRVRRTGHWQQVLHTFPEPVRVEAGQALRLVAAHNRSNLMFYLD